MFSRRVQILTVRNALSTVGILFRPGFPETGSHSVRVATVLDRCPVVQSRSRRPDHRPECPGEPTERLVMSKIFRRLPVIGGLLRKLSMRRKKKSDGDATMYPLY